MATKKNKEAENTEKEVVEVEAETEVEAKEEEAGAEEEEKVEAEKKTDAEGAASEKKQKGKKKGKSKKEDVPPGAHLEPMLAEESEAREETDEDVAARYAAELEGLEEKPTDDDEKAEPSEETGEQELKVKPVKLDAGKAFQATGKRKRSIARINLKAGTGEFVVNGHTLEEYFPRDLLRFQVLQPLQACKARESVDIVALVHGGGISGQAQAVGHGIARALESADPELRGILKKRGHLTRDSRVKERRKAGLKKARKRPQFSKR